MRRTGRFALVAAVIALIALSPSAPRAQTSGSTLAPTLHTRLPADPTAYWLAPGSAEGRAAKSAAMAQFAEAVKQEVDGNFARALPAFAQKSPQLGPLADYAAYYHGLAELRLGRPADAKRTFQILAEKSPVGFLAEGVALRTAECDEALADYAGALEI